MLPFTYSSSSSRVLFGQGALQLLPDEVRRMGLLRVLVLSTAGQANDARRLRDMIGTPCVGVFSEAEMHTPIHVTERAVDVIQSLDVDGIVAIGGGSTTGLSKAIALRTRLPQIVIPTTYAGSEVTPILGQTDKGVKTTIRDPAILPNIVIYDPDLTLSLPAALSVTSGLNAMAHALEGLYAQNRNPISSMMALEGVRTLHTGLPAIQQKHDDGAARSAALYGSWLCGTVLGTVGMSLHHKLCHTLGGMFDLPHAETHSILLPYTIAYNTEAAAAELSPLRETFGESIPGGIFDFARRLGAPRSLVELGIGQVEIDLAASEAMRNPYWNPRRLEIDGISRLLAMALEGARPH